MNVTDILYEEGVVGETGCPQAIGKYNTIYKFFETNLARNISPSPKGLMG